MIAIYGKNFCRSARDAFNLLMRNILKVAVMDRVTDFVLILGKILVAGCIVEDLERNDGSAERPYYMSQSLLKILNEQNAQTKKQ
eukprot:bmy_17312T0